MSWDRASAFAGLAALAAASVMQGCAPLPPAPSPVAAAGAPWEGTFSGPQVPDGVQDATRARCRTETVRRTVTARGGQAEMAFGAEKAVGRWEADGAFHLATPTRSITLTPTIDPATNRRMLFGRLLAGGGPWCKYTFRLDEAAS